MKLYNLWDSSDGKFLYIERVQHERSILRWVNELTGGRRIFLGDDDVMIFETMHTLYVGGGFNDPEDCEYFQDIDNMIRSIYKFVNTTTDWHTAWFLPVVYRVRDNCNMDYVNGFQI